MRHRLHILTCGVIIAGTLLPAMAWGEKWILFGGDTDFAESYRDRDERILANGYDFGFTGLRPFLERADWAIVNLEVPIVDPVVFPSPFQDSKAYVHWGDYREVSAALRRNGIDAVSLANNHTLDHGFEGLFSTLLFLEREGIEVFGADIDRRKAELPHEHVIEIDGKILRLAVFGTFEFRDVYEERYHWYARNDRPGSAFMNDDGEPTASLISDYKARYPEAFVVVFPHWGRNYVWRSDVQRMQADALVNAGADLVIGHGAHCMQDIEKIDNTWVVYSLGNFLFNTPGRFARYQEERGILPFGMVAMCRFAYDEDDLSVTLRLYPIYSDNRVTGYQPHPVSAEDFEAAFFELRGRLEASSPGAEHSLRKGKDKLGYHLEVPAYMPQR